MHKNNNSIADWVDADRFYCHFSVTQVQRKLQTKVHVHVYVYSKHVTKHTLNSYCNYVEYSVWKQSVPGVCVLSALHWLLHGSSSWSVVHVLKSRVHNLVLKCCISGWSSVWATHFTSESVLYISSVWLCIALATYHALSVLSQCNFFTNSMYPSHELCSVFRPSKHDCLGKSLLNDVITLSISQALVQATHGCLDKYLTNDVITVNLTDFSPSNTWLSGQHLCPMSH